MAFRRRRKPNVAWLPNLNGSTQGPGYSTTLTDDIAVGTLYNSATTAFTRVFALTADFGADALTVQSLQTLADYEGGGYRLRRIVGKFHAVFSQNNGGSRALAAQLSAGFIILRTSVNGSPLQAATPNTYSVNLSPNERDPWIWRRSWILANAAAPETDDFWGWAPTSTMEYGSVLDGPHIDQKTARRVGAEERLFFVVSTLGMSDPALPIANDGLIKFALDYRILATPLKLSGNRRNASR